MLQLRCCSRTARAVALAALPVLAWATLASGQVRPLPPQSPTRPPTLQRPPESHPDLMISSVGFQEVLQGTPVLIATVTVKNVGTADGVLGMGGAGLSTTTPNDAPFFGAENLPATSLKPGQARAVGMTLSLCGGTPSGGRVNLVNPVTFVVGKATGETNETNNSMTAKLPLSILRAALSIRSVRLRSPQAPPPGPPNDSAGWSTYASDLVVHIQNTGSGPALLCPNRSLVAVVSTPPGGPQPPNLGDGGSSWSTPLVIGNTTGQAILIPVTGTASPAYVVTMPDALHPNQLLAGSSTWKLQLNPFHNIPGTFPAEPSAHVVWLK